jgi:hypothetical protein
MKRPLTAEQIAAECRAQAECLLRIARMLEGDDTPDEACTGDRQLRDPAGLAGEAASRSLRSHQARWRLRRG